MPTLRAFAYDSRDNITAVTDARDNRTSATKPDGVVLSSTYDGLSRLTRIAGGDIERTYGYDAQSNLLAANDNLNSVAGPDLGFTYDAENRLETASVTNLFGAGVENNVFTYGYRERGNIAEICPAPYLCIGFIPPSHSQCCQHL